MKHVVRFVVVASAFFAIQCAKPTQIVVETYSEVDCAQRPQIALIGGAGFSDLKTNAPSAFAQQCEPGVQRRGNIVIQPSGSNDSTIAFQVLTRNDDAAPDITCNPDDGYKGCIVSRRRLRFAPHETIHLRIDLRLSCLDTPCGEDETCVRGGCFQATIPDSCNADDCDEDALLGGRSPPDLDAGDAATDAEAGNMGCAPGLTPCAGNQCLDLTSAEHCGSCTAAPCPQGQVCSAGSCKPPPCLPNGSGPCTPGSTGGCCSGYCPVTGVCSACPLKQMGTTCGSGGECCSGQCNGQCCTPTGQSCVASDLCCNGTCVIPSGKIAGTCPAPF